MSGNPVEIDAIERIAAFTDDPRGGNPAGVWVGDAMPSAAAMQATAAEVGYSETAFLVAETPRRWRVRYFAPAAEVPFCGHATIAAGFVLGRRHGPGLHCFRLNAGEIDVEVSETPQGETRTTLTTVEPSVQPAPPGVVASALAALGWSPADLHPSFPPAEADAGARHLVLVTASRDRLGNLDYDFDALRTVCVERDYITVQLAWPAAGDEWHVRDPFPIGGVVEDPATGAAAAAFGAYLRDLDLRPAPFALTLHQGDDMGRPSRLFVDVDTADRPRIRVSGTAVRIP